MADSRVLFLSKSHLFLIISHSFVWTKVTVKKGWSHYTTYKLRPNMHHSSSFHNLIDRKPRFDFRWWLWCWCKRERWWWRRWCRGYKCSSGQQSLSSLGSFSFLTCKRWKEPNFHEDYKQTDTYGKWISASKRCQVHTIEMKRGFCRSRHPNKHGSDNGEHSPEEQYQNSCSPVHLLQNKCKPERENFECLVELERVFVFWNLTRR